MILHLNIKLSHGHARVHLDRFQANESNDHFPLYTKRGHHYIKYLSTVAIRNDFFVDSRFGTH